MHWIDVRIASGTSAKGRACSVGIRMLFATASYRRCILSGSAATSGACIAVMFQHDGSVEHRLPSSAKTIGGKTGDRPLAHPLRLWFRLNDGT